MKDNYGSGVAKTMLKACVDARDRIGGYVNLNISAWAFSGDAGEEVSYEVAGNNIPSHEFETLEEAITFVKNFNVVEE
jgi:hypothetical protein